MAIEFVSNESLSEAALKDMTFWTPYGEFGWGVGNYFIELKAKGYTMTETQVKSLDNMVSRLKAAGIWDNVVEFFPMFGTTLDQLLCRAKFIPGKNITPVNFTSANAATNELDLFTNFSAATKVYLSSDIKLSELVSRGGIGIAASMQYDENVNTLRSSLLASDGGNYNVGVTKTQLAQRRFDASSPADISLGTDRLLFINNDVINAAGTAVVNRNFRTNIAGKNFTDTNTITVAPVDGHLYYAFNPAGATASLKAKFKFLMLTSGISNLSVPTFYSIIQQYLTENNKMY